MTRKYIFKLVLSCKTIFKKKQWNWVIIQVSQLKCIDINAQFINIGNNDSFPST